MYWRTEFRGIGSAFLQAANGAVSPLDRLARHKRGSVAEPIIVVGLPRSGTTLAYELIVQAFDVAFLTRIYGYTYGLPNLTTRVISRFTGSPAARYESRYGRIPGLLSPAENHVIWMRWFQATRKLGHYVPPALLNEQRIAEARIVLASMTAIAGRPFVFKNVYFTTSLVAILETFPGARIVVVKRDFNAICASVYKARSKIRGRHWWSIRPPFWEETQGADDLEQTVFQCLRTKQLLDREIQRAPSNRCFVVDYDELCERPRAFLQMLQRWTESLLLPRSGSEIPGAFERQSSTGFPEHLRDRFDELRTTFSLDCDQYLRRVDEQVGVYARTASA